MSENDAQNPAPAPTVLEKLLAALGELSVAQRIVLGTLLVFGGYVVYDQMYYWLNREDYEFGFLVSIFVMYVVHERWGKIRSVLVGEPNAAPDPPDKPAKRAFFGLTFYTGLFAALIMFMIGVFFRLITGINEFSTVMMTLGFGFYWMSVVYVISAADARGRPVGVPRRLQLVNQFWFPSFAWLISAPLLVLLETRIKTWLLLVVTTVVFGLFDFLGYPITQEGNVLVLPKGNVGVADACSGIRSLTGCLFAGCFLAAIYFEGWGKKIFLVVMAGILAVCTNVIRSIILTAVAYNEGPQAIEGTIHDVTGYAVLGVTCVLLLVLVHLMTKQWIPPPPTDEELADSQTPCE